jgi:hypothetical protein
MIFGTLFEGSPLGGQLRELDRAVLADMRTDPGLVAAVDQHAAAVRQSITAAGNQVGRESLTRYLHGFADGVRAWRWTPAATGSGHDWETLRLAAICWLAREHGLHT